MRLVPRTLASVTLVLFAACAQESPLGPLTHPGAKASLSITPALVPCVFTNSGTTETLVRDCVTDVSIVVPNGWTLNGNKHTITGVDPAGGHFVGGVIQNGGLVAYVKNTVVTVSNLADACDGGTDRLRGIIFDGASGAITGNTVHDLTQAGSGCQEGNSIEVRNFGANPNTATIEISENTITNFMKTGIVANGNVKVSMHNNTIGASANQASLAANSIQLAFGAQGSVNNNTVSGNQWCTRHGDFATGILVYEADPDTGVPLTVNANINNNVSKGNSDVGIYLFGNGMNVYNNQVADAKTADCNMDGTDIGILNDPNTPAGGSGANNIHNNDVTGFTTPYSNVSGKNNKFKP